MSHCVPLGACLLPEQVGADEVGAPREVDLLLIDELVALDDAVDELGRWRRPHHLDACRVGGVGDEVEGRADRDALLGAHPDGLAVLAEALC